MMMRKNGVDLQRVGDTGWVMTVSLLVHEDVVVHTTRCGCGLHLCC